MRAGVRLEPEGSDLDEDVSVLWPGQKPDVIVIEVIAEEVGMELGYNWVL